MMWRACLALSGLVAGAPALAQDGPIIIERQGSFSVGDGEAQGEDGSSQSCDHGFIEYQSPPDARALLIFFWHSSSTTVWANRWDMGEGF